MESVEISVIVPVYNVEAYIEEAMVSLLDQLTAGVEVIVVDDGSPDGSIGLVHKVLERYPQWRDQVRIVTQRNAGVSAARNRGIALAEGRYLAFLDPDDVALKGYFEALGAVLREYPEVEVVGFNAIYFTHSERGEPRGTRALDIHREPRHYRAGAPDAEARMAQVIHSGQWYVWAGLYHRRLFDGREFDRTLSMFEDAMLIPELYLAAGEIVCLDRALLGYRINPTSAVNSVAERQLDDIRRVIARYRELVRAHRGEQRCNHALSVFCGLVRDYHFTLQRRYPLRRAVEMMRDEFALLVEGRPDLDQALADHLAGLEFKRRSLFQHPYLYNLSKRLALQLRALSRGQRPRIA